VTSLGTGRQTLGDRYELHALIAAGGMGQVWRGHDRLLDRPVAVKVLRSEYADDRVFLERFRSEARHAAALSHPNIAAVLDYGESEDAGTGEHLAYLVMELVDGAPLSARLEREGPLEPEAALSVLRQTAAGLAEAHRAGVVHRDVKPANILVRPDGRVKLTDFGIAWSAESVPLTRTGQVIGTARYMSPEQAAGERVGPASDVYALGLVGYESLTGHPPFEGTNPVTVALKQVREQPQPLPEEVPPGVRSLIDAALVKDPGARPPDAGAFLTAVEDTIERTTRPRPAAPPTAPVAAVPVPAAPAGPPPAEQPTRRRRALLLAPVLAVALAGLLLALLWPDGSGGGRTPAQAATPTGATGESAAAAASVLLDAADHVGRPADEVAAELTALGLTVDRRTEETTAVDAGAVAGLDPVGVALQPGDVVTLTVAAAPSAPAPDGAPGGPAPADAVPADAVPSGAVPGGDAGTAPGSAPSGPARAPSPEAPAPAPPAGVPSAEAPGAPAAGAPAPGAPSPAAPADPAPSAGAPSDPAPSPTAPAPSPPPPSDPAPSPTEPAPGTPQEPPATPSAPVTSEPAAPEPEAPEEQPGPPEEPPAPDSATSSAPAGTPADPGTGAAG
jgi:serine/threonine-protein kinase